MQILAQGLRFHIPDWLLGYNDATGPQNTL